MISVLSMWSEAELRTALLHLATVAAVGSGALFVGDVSLTLARKCGVAPPRLIAALERRPPAAIRHLAELAVTAILTVGATRPATASTTPVRDWLTQAPAPTTTTAVHVAPTTTTTSPSPPHAPPTTPARPAAPSQPSPSPAPSISQPAPIPISPPRSVDVYVVRAGDCLWRIAARHLGAGATNAAIDAAWRAIYAVNRAAIGDDPNLIHPGLTLTLPPLSARR
jgi:resuscitation-promoting factor RpfA